MRVPSHWRRAQTLSVIVPVWNERQTLPTVLSRLLAKELPSLAIEVIIVESNSTDGSRQLVEAWRDHPRVTLLLQPAARGKGHAVRAGLAVATGEIILIQDADLEYDLADYERLLAPLLAGETTFVLGSRHGPSAWRMRTFGDRPGLSWLCNAAHWGCTLWLNLSLGVWLRDPFTMYKVFRTECLAELELTCDRFDFDWELVIKLIRAGHRPREIPVRYRSRGFAEGKKIRLLADPPTWLRAWWRARFGRWRAAPRPTPLSAPLERSTVDAT